MFNTMFKRIKERATGLAGFAETRWRDVRSEVEESNRWMKWALLVVVLYLLLCLILGIYWSFGEPDLFDVREQTLIELKNDEDKLVTGAVTTSTLIHVMEVMLDKPGGYLSNDVTPPGVWLDNVPNWEYGVLVQARDFAKALREAFSVSQSQSQSLADEDLVLAEPRFNFRNDSWILPDTKNMYEEGQEHLRSYLARLVDEQEKQAQFYARADNLRYWLLTVETRLGSLSQRLSASVGQKRINTDLAGDPNATQSTPKDKEFYQKTPWNEIDDVFYEARGSAWALIHFLKAVEVDFARVLQNKEALVSLQQIIRELEATQQPIFSPVVLNGSGFGILTNHSLVMASYISRANAAIIDLRELLAQG